MTSTRDPGRGGHRRRGQSLVEFALVLPVFLLLLFGLIDAGRFVYLHSVLSQAARESARLAAVEASWIGSTDSSCGQPGGPTCPTDSPTLQTHVVSAANRMVTPFGPVTTGNVTMRCDTGAAPSGNWTTNTCNPTTNAQAGDVVSVRIQVTFRPITPIISGIMGSITTSGSATMAIN